jgi:O-antigen ligase
MAGPSAYIWERLPWQPSHAHNGYFELWLQLGLVSIVLFSLVVVKLLFQAFSLYLREGTAATLFAILFVFFTLLGNISEAGILTRNSLGWIVTVAFTIQLSLGPRRVPTLGVDPALLRQSLSAPAAELGLPSPTSGLAARRRTGNLNPIPESGAYPSAPG